MGKISKILIKEEDIRKRVKELASEISSKHKKLTLLCVLKGSVIFCSDLCRELSKNGVDVRIEFIRAKSYISTDSSGSVSIDDAPYFHGRDVLIVEDIIDTGQTLKKLLEKVRSDNKNKTLTCTLLDKPSKRVIEIKADYSGFEIEDFFVVGYGLDCDEQFRELPYIGIYEE